MVAENFSSLICPDSAMIRNCRQPNISISLEHEKLFHICMDTKIINDSLTVLFTGVPPAANFVEKF